MTPTAQLLYFGALEDYNRLKADAVAFASLPSTSFEEVKAILFVINGGTSDAGCMSTSTIPRCLDGADGMIRGFEALRSAGAASPSAFDSVSFALATAAAQIRATTGGL